jgi:hypothetical protein
MSLCPNHPFNSNRSAHKLNSLIIWFRPAPQWCAKQKTGFLEPVFLLYQETPHGGGVVDLGSRRNAGMNDTSFTTA